MEFAIYFFMGDTHKQVFRFSKQVVFLAIYSFLDAADLLLWYALKITNDKHTGKHSMIAGTTGSYSGWGILGPISHPHQIHM